MLRWCGLEWAEAEELELVELVREGRSVEELAEHFHRSPEAIMVKAKRLGVSVCGSVKVSCVTTTTGGKSLGVAECLIGYEEAMRRLFGGAWEVG